MNRIVEISDAGRASKNDPAIFALALVVTHGDARAKAHAFANLGKVCRIGPHLFHFAEYVSGSKTPRGKHRRRRRKQPPALSISFPLAD